MRTSPSAASAARARPRTSIIKADPALPQLIQTCPVEIFYCGKTDFKAVSAAMRDAFSAMPRGEIDYDIGTDVRMNAVEDHVRFVEEEMDVTQGKLVLGFRLGEGMEEPDMASLSVFNAVYGSGATSKLFMNVREKAVAVLLCKLGSVPAQGDNARFLGHRV